MNAAPPRVLVVDDEPPMRKLLRMGLSAHGYHVIEATNGKNALELLGKSPDIIILDLGLPDIQGHDLLRSAALTTAPGPCNRTALRLTHNQTTHTH